MRDEGITKDCKEGRHETYPLRKNGQVELIQLATMALRSVLDALEFDPTAGSK